MKTSLLTLVAAVAFALSAHAQGLDFGIKAGVNIANQDYEGDGISISPDSRTAFHAGVYLTYMFNEQFGIQPELIYNQEGSKWDMFDEESTVKIDYLSLPILFRYQPIELLNFQLGPQFSYRLNAEAEDENIDDETKDIEIGGAIGAGVDLPVGVGLSVRYVLGLSDAFDVEDVTVKNNVFQVSLTYRFRISE